MRIELRLIAVALLVGTAPAPASSASIESPGSAPAQSSPAGSDRETHLLALSWETAFCETRPGKPECRGETIGSPEARELSLHGLWPQPEGVAYCHVADDLAALDRQGRWDQLPEPAMTPATRARLAAVMPGVQSLLERHEWIKHGTCFGATADAYFNRAADLVEQVNGSKLGALLAADAGKTVTSADLLAAFDQSFGAGAGAAVVIKCQSGGGGSEISEIDISLTGDVTGTSPLGRLLHAQAKSSCASGRLVQPSR